MEQELILHMVLEPHYNIVPNCAESVLTRLHLRHDASVDMSVKMPALDIAHVAPLYRDGEADGDGGPAIVVCGVSEFLLLVQGWKDSVAVHQIKVELGTV